MNLFKFAPTLIFITACAHNQTGEPRKIASQECLETRAAFDVGSATTRLMVAEVDKCEQKILTVLKKEERNVPYKDDLERNHSTEFSAQLQQRGLGVFSELRSIGSAEGAKRFAGTATSAFRGATNAQAYIARVNSETGVSIHVIEQQTEAQLGYLAAVGQPDVRADGVVVWDIGGGSMQFSAREDKEMKTSLVELGSVGFKNMVLKQLKPNTPLNVSPNPLGAENFDVIVGMAKRHALQHTETTIRSLLKKREVIGIGNVHAFSVLRQTGQTKSYDRSQVAAALRERLQWDDAKVGGPYAATDVTNLALVLGYMEALDIPVIRPLNVNLTNGSVLYPQFWPNGLPPK